MYKWSLPGLLFVPSRIYIPLQETEVVGLKVDIRLDLIVFFHDTILMKAITIFSLMFLQFYRKQFRCNREVHSEREFSKIQCIIKISVLDKFSYLRSIKYTCLMFFHAFSLKLMMEKKKISNLFCTMPLQNFFMRPSFMQSVVSNILFYSPRG